MAATQQTTSSAAATPSLAVKRNQRRKLRRAGAKKRALKLRTDKEFAKTFFEARSKRSNDKKSAFRKKKSRKK